MSINGIMSLLWNDLVLFSLCSSKVKHDFSICENADCVIASSTAHGWLGIRVNDVYFGTTGTFRIHDEAVHFQQGHALFLSRLTIPLRSAQSSLRISLKVLICALIKRIWGLLESIDSQLIILEYLRLFCLFYSLVQDAASLFWRLLDIILTFYSLFSHLI